MRRVIVSIVLAAAVVTASQAHAQQPEVRAWALEQILHGEAVRTVHPGVTVDRVEVTETRGDVFVTACCGPQDCTRSNSYRLGWTTPEPYRRVVHSQRISLSLSAVMTRNGGCTEIDPGISACGMDGCPSPLIGERRVQLRPGNPLMSGGGGPFYVNPSHPSHVPSPRTIQVWDRGSPPFDGYFRVSIEERWGLDYEFVWLYRPAPATPPSPPPAAPQQHDDGGICAVGWRTPATGTSAGIAPVTSAVLISLALVWRANVARRRRKPS